MGETQQSMSEKLGCALQSVARWETAMEPQGSTLYRLSDLAREHGYEDLEKVFGKAIEKFKETDRREAETIERQTKNWTELQHELWNLMQESVKLSEENHAAGARIREITERISMLVALSRWRPLGR
jgi:hypothetical protein